MSGPVKTITVGNGSNRLSPLQLDILQHLGTFGEVKDGRIGHLPRTGDIVDALGRPRTNSAFASVSRSLARLRKLGLVDAYLPSIQTRGSGAHWSLRR